MSRFNSLFADTSRDTTTTATKHYTSDDVSPASTAETLATINSTVKPNTGMYVNCNNGRW